MKFGYAFAIALLTAQCAIAQTPNFLWAASFGSGLETGYAAELGRAITVDKSGNIYVAGYFNSTNALFGTNILTTRGDFDALVMKLDPSGNVLWARSAGGSDDDDYAYAIAVDSTGNVYVAGEFYSTNAIFSGVTVTNSSPIADSAFFLARYDPDGNLLWVRAPDKNYTSFSDGLALDASDNIYLAATLNRTNLIGGTNLVANADDAVILKYDPNGTLVWSKLIGGAGYEGTSAIAYAAGAIALTGTFSSQQLQLDSVTLTNSGTSSYADIFVAKLDLDGHVLWAQSAGAPDFPDHVNALGMDQTGNVFIAGFLGSAYTRFGNLVLSNTSQSVYLVKYSADGTPLWARQSFGTALSQDSAEGIAIDFAGNCNLTGIFRGTNIQFGPITLTNAGPNGGLDCFITKYDPSGNVLGAQRAGGDNVDDSLGIACDAQANCYITGFFWGSNVLYGATALTSQYLDIFVAKLTTDQPRLSAALLGDNHLLLSWVDQPNIIIEASTNLLPSDWSPAITGETVVVSNGIATLPVMTTPQQQFFRLRRN